MKAWAAAVWVAATVAASPVESRSNCRPRHSATISLASPTAASGLAREIVAVWRGLQFDLISTGDAEAVAASYAGTASAFAQRCHAARDEVARDQVACDQMTQPAS